MDAPTALVLGGANGIGRACCDAFAASGAQVVVADLDGAAARSTADAITARGGVAWPAPVDATDVDAVQHLVDDTVERFGGLDAAVHTVYRDSPAPIDELDPAEWDAVISVGLRSAYALAHAAIPVLCDRPGGGSLTFVSSIQAAFGFSLMSAYSAAKAGVLGLVRQLAVEYGPRGVRVNAVAPALVLTDRNRTSWTADPALLDRQARLFPLRRVGQPDDVARVVRFLASDDAAFVTGTVIPVDGGMAAQSASSTTSREALDNR